MIELSTVVVVIPSLVKLSVTRICPGLVVRRVSLMPLTVGSILEAVVMVSDFLGVVVVWVVTRLVV